jgi:hypothetical protein
MVETATPEDKPSYVPHVILPGLVLLHIALQLWITQFWDLAPERDHLTQPAIAYGYLLGWVAAVVTWSVISREPRIVRTLGGAALIWFSATAFATSAVASVSAGTSSGTMRGFPCDAWCQQAEDRGSAKIGECPCGFVNACRCDLSRLACCVSLLGSGRPHRPRTLGEGAGDCHPCAQEIRLFPAWVVNSNRKVVCDLTS